MLQAFKLADGALVPFSVVCLATKESTTYLRIRILSYEGLFVYCFSSQKDRDQQLANFEAWLTTPTLL